MNNGTDRTLPMSCPLEVSLRPLPLGMVAPELECSQDEMHFNTHQLDSTLDFLTLVCAAKQRVEI